MVQRAARRSAAEWSQIVAEFDPAREAEQAFCDRRGLLWVTFHKWYRVAQGLSKPRSRRRRSSLPARFVQVSIPTSTAHRIGDVLTVHAGDVRIECPVSLGIESIAQLVKAVRHER
jgi:hypothetical protein